MKAAGDILISIIVSKFEEVNVFIMSVAEMKQTIMQKVETLSEEQLTELKQFIDRINNISTKEYDLLTHVENIVSEREELLKKLAQ